MAAELTRANAMEALKCFGKGKFISVPDLHGNSGDTKLDAPQADARRVQAQCEQELGRPPCPALSTIIASSWARWACAWPSGGGES